MSRRATLHQRVERLEQVCLNLLRTLEELATANDRAMALIDDRIDRLVKDLTDKENR